MEPEQHHSEWLAAAAVIAATVVVVVLDLTDSAFDHWFDRHGFTTNIASTLLGLAIGALVIDRVVARRQLRSRSRVMAGQSAIIAGQAARTTDLVRDARNSNTDRDIASQELRTLTTLLLVSAQVLMDAEVTRRFLEDCDRLVALLASALADDSDARPGTLDKALDAAAQRVHETADKLLSMLRTDERVTVSGLDQDPPQ